MNINMPIFFRALSESFCVLCFAFLSCFSSEAKEVRLGIMGFTLPAPNQPILGESVKTLEEAFKKHGLQVSYIPFSDLRKEACSGNVDLLITSAGMYRQLQSCGVRDLANVISDLYPNPNSGEGAAFVVLGSSGIHSLADMKGRVVAVNSTSAFPGYQIPLHEIFKSGFNPENFFSRVIPLGGRNYSSKALKLLKEGKVDVIFLKQCLLELYLRGHPGDTNVFKVIGNKASKGQCARSTSLYPTWTISTTKAVNPEISKRATLSLLSMPPVDSGYRWAVATDYSAVDALLKDLMLGPYAYLKEKTLRRFLSEYWPFLSIFILGVFFLAFHSWRTEVVVRKRTSEVKRLLEEKIRLREVANTASNRLERLQKVGAVNQICSILAHECGQPIATISVYCELIKNMLRDKQIDPHSLMRVIGLVEKQNKKVFDIVEKVRSYRKETKGQLRHLNLSEVVRKAVASFEEAALGSSASLICNIQENLFGKADALEIELVVVNLLKNAVEASSGSEGKVYVNFSEENTRAQLVVSNEGPGLTETQLKNIRNEKFDTSKENGLGLGLSIVKGIVERHKARINFEKNTSGGLTVTVSFKEYKDAGARE